MTVRNGPIASPLALSIGLILGGLMTAVFLAFGVLAGALVLIAAALLTMRRGLFMTAGWLIGAGAVMLLLILRAELACGPAAGTSGCSPPNVLPLVAVGIALVALGGVAAIRAR